ncbi:aspartic peptidase domain-containing protein [Xylaria intraflava]|nr:aspartic peptidase domain-containing protein [Xylaria intraflava]
MSRWHALVTIVGTLLFVPSLVDADGPTAEWLEPSGNWYGIDGNWSSMRLSVGEPAQDVDVVVSTSISEIWVVEDGGCESPACNGARGGVFNRSASKSWSPMGLWPLGMKGLFHTNGDYGMDTVAAYDNVTQAQTSFGKLLVAGVNDTAAYTGFFGLGITKGGAGIVAQGPIASMVEQRGLIPSHSYGFTAGAYYAGANGVPMSLVLGGYDANRFEPHDVQFDLHTATRQPRVLVQSITATVSDITQAPTKWSAPSTLLLSSNESITVTVDSSTPYLWLPPAICDRFASNLNLTWNETFDLYLFSSPDDLERYRSAPDLSFTFALSNAGEDNAPSSVNVSDIVNITISANAFLQSIRYPFKNLTDDGAPAIPYFTLKKTEHRNRLTIGRSFLQEAYIITNYETGMFSIHEARFPSDPFANTSIQTIAASPSSPYPGPPKDEGPSTMSHNQIAGTVIGACLGSIALVATALFVRRKRRESKESKEYDNGNGAEKPPGKYPMLDPESPISPTATAWFRMKSPAKNNQNKTLGDQGHGEAYGVGVNKGYERYEMPASLPVELDATNTTASAYFTVLAEEDTLGQGLYNRPQQWVRPPQTAGLKGYPKPTSGNINAAHTPKPINTHCCDYPSPMSSPAQEYDTDGAPSPVTPASDGTTYLGGYSSPVAGFSARTLSEYAASNPALVCIPPSPIDASYSRTRLRSVSSVASSCKSPISITSPLIQRTPIDSTHVVCLGPLPENIWLPHQLMMHRPRTQGPDIGLPTIPIIAETRSRPQSIADTLGSNYTLEEEARIARDRNDSTAFDGAAGCDIERPPKATHRRYSWEVDLEEGR